MAGTPPVLNLKPYTCPPHCRLSLSLNSTFLSISPIQISDHSNGNSPTRLSPHHLNHPRFREGLAPPRPPLITRPPGSALRARLPMHVVPSIDSFGPTPLLHRQFPALSVRRSLRHAVSACRNCSCRGRFVFRCRRCIENLLREAKTRRFGLRICALG